MKKNIAISVIALGLLSSVNVYGAEDLSSMFSEGKTSGQIRLFSVDREYQGSAGTTTHRNGTALGGHLKFETADYEGLSFGTALYTTNKIASSPTIDPSLLGPDDEGYSILGEAYLQYKYENTTFKGGRQKLDTPLAGSDDARMLPNLFEAYVLSNTDIEGTTLVAAHATKFAQGTFGRVYSNGILAATGGYSFVDAKNQVGDFVNMGTYAVGRETDGVSIVSASYTGIEGLKLQLWDYYAHDILNAVYGQADFSWKCLLNDSVKPFVAAQFIKENDVGDKLLKNAGGDGSIDSLFWGAKIGLKVENFTAYVAYTEVGANSETDKANGAYQNAIITPWGGIPAFTQGMVTRNMFLAGTKASKIAASYNWKAFGPDLSTDLYYLSHEMDANSGYGIARTSTESGFDIIYNNAIVKNLQLRARGNFPRSFNEAGEKSIATDPEPGTTGWSEYRFIANYNF